MITTLCYLEKDDKYLMLYRNKKKVDINKGKWLGVGGKLEKGEMPEQCLKREVKEETGYKLKSYKYRGLVIFNYNDDEPLFIYLYTSSDFYGIEKKCNEGELRWIRKEEIFNLELWEGDKIFLELLFKNSPFFYLILNYENNDLISSKLEFKINYSCFEVFVPENYVEKIVENLQRYSLLTEGFYADVYSTIETVGHWKTLQGGNPFDGKVGQESTVCEKIMRFRVKREFEELAYYLIKDIHPYEIPVINVFRTEV
ncbi:NUDIX domain-containing protein [Leptotrichia sp. OH3620_COT-345]|uniref:NUDIX hydrolase n=1 Tax=Leptotrichia sp. OH3620_COT-345 TaxID=2491048 RepID=UPI000F65055B|nr:NUDIX domain-containing protein [Leptotrichia sp. OH3620_COT-345]RRD39768.1 NUDIX domain-containing protein [Leptotrichia sp. OH3620_COT-345]